MNCAACHTDKDLLTCGFCVEPVCFCPEDMVVHLETVHTESLAARGMANQLREALGKSEAGLLKLSSLTAYQASVFHGLTQTIETFTMSDDRALELIAKHEAMISERERRHFDPFVTAKAIRQAEPESSEREKMLAALRTAKETIRAFNGLGMSGAVEQVCWDAYQHSPEMKQINEALGE